MKPHYRILLRLAPYLRAHWRTVAAGALCALVAGGLAGVIAWLVKPVMDGIFINRDVTMLKLVPLAILGVSLVKGAAAYGEGYFIAAASERAVARLRREVYTHIQGMPVAFFISRHSGELQARVVTDVNRVARLFSYLVVDTVRRSGTIVAMLVVMLARNWVLALIAVVAFPALALTVWALGRQLYRINRRTQERIAELFVLLQESFTGAKIVKAFGREGFEQTRWDRLNNRLLGLALKDIRIDELSKAVMEVLGAFSIVGIVWYAGSLVISGVLTPGEAFSFMAAVALLQRAVRELIRTFNTVQQSLASVERVFEILDSPPAIVDAPGAGTLADFRDRIVFDDVSFRYPGAESDTLRNISLTVRRGEKVAFVGLSGSGKTTLMDLLPRLNDVTAGRITIDGLDLRQVTLSSLRSLFGLVTQGTFLFHDTLEYNIAYGKPGATREEVEDAARRAHAHDFIMALPAGYQTMVGERGVKLSGGQRQRIAIARAFVKSPPILILDEATSELDAESESVIQDALAALMAGRTLLVIAHRLRTVRSADRVVVVHDGRIVETGRHLELLARTDGIYRRLASLQLLDVTGG
ncbi:MAG TPA: ABC transporter ATP-binding protein [Methylomirabilota bacterium]